jgi:hypothetical protein
MLQAQSAGVKVSVPSTVSSSSTSSVKPVGTNVYNGVNIGSYQGTDSKGNDARLALMGMDTGGYTGDNVSDDGALALLHAKERVLSPTQTRAFEDLVYNMIPQMTGIRKPDVSGFSGSSSVSSSNVDNSIVVNIDKVVSNDAKSFLDQLKRIVRSK